METFGCLITSDLKWKANTEFLNKKAYKRLWLIKRLKQMGASLVSLLDIDVKHVRSVVEIAAVVWTSSLTKQDIGSIEKSKTVHLPLYWVRSTEVIKKHVQNWPWRLYAPGEKNLH